MRQAPPVSVLCRGRGWRHFQSAVFALTGAVLAAWLVWHGVEALGPAGLGLVLLAFVLSYGASMRWLPSGVVELRWDGQQWWLDAQPCVTDLMLQNRHFALLRLGAATGTTWLVVERAEAAAAWHGLLVALRHPGSPSAFSVEGQVG